MRVPIRSAPDAVSFIAAYDRRRTVHGPQLRSDEPDRTRSCPSRRAPAWRRAAWPDGTGPVWHRKDGGTGISAEAARCRRRQWAPYRPAGATGLHARRCRGSRPIRTPAGREAAGNPRNQDKRHEKECPQVSNEETMMECEADEAVRAMPLAVRATTRKAAAKPAAKKPAAKKPAAKKAAAKKPAAKKAAAKKPAAKKAVAKKPAAKKAVAKKPAAKKAVAKKPAAKKAVAKKPAAKKAAAKKPAAKKAVAKKPAVKKAAAKKPAAKNAVAKKPAVKKAAKATAAKKPAVRRPRKVAAPAMDAPAMPESMA
ncbi:MAG: histone H1-like repetitive region-containing protein [Rhodospirillales bacterium]|nr:histone H1-like repetitive region-containing protein [Rhodospirillales bacterium]